MSALNPYCSSFPVAPIPCSSSAAHQSRLPIAIYDSSLPGKKPIAFDFSRGKPNALRILVFYVQTRTVQSPKSLTLRRNSKVHAKSDVELLDLGEKDDFLTPFALKDQFFGDYVSKDEPSVNGEENHVGVFAEEECEASKGNFDLVEGFDKWQVNLEAEKENGENPAKGNCVCDDFAIGKANGFRATDVIKKIMILPVEERVKVLDLFFSDDKSLRISDYNDILKALVKAGEYQMVISLFSELRSRSIEPDAWSFSILIQCLCKKGQTEEAKRILDEMVQSGFSPNVVTFTTVVNSLCNKGKLKKAFEVLETMKQIGCQPEVRTYNCLISGLCYVGRLEEALELLEKMKKSSKMPDMYTYTLVIHAFCKVGQTDQAKELLKEGEELGLMPNVIAYNAVLNGYCKEGRPMDALRLLKDMQRKLCLPDFTSYSTVMQCLLKRGEESAAWNIYKEMKSAGFIAEEHAVNLLLQSLCRQSTRNPRMLDNAKELYQAAIEMNHSLSTYTCCLMVEALAKNGEVVEALSHLHELLRAGYCPRMMTYNIIVRVLCDHSRVDDASVIMFHMIRRGITPSRFTFRTLLREFAQQGRPLEPLKYLQQQLKCCVCLVNSPCEVGN